MATTLVIGYVLNQLDNLTLSIINKATGNDTASFLAFNNDNIKSTLVSKHNNYHELSYKHVCDNPKITFDNIVKKLKNVDIIGKDIGTVSKKNDDLQTNDLIAISWITNLVILPFKVSSAVFYNVLNVYENDDYFNIIIHSAANSYNAEYMNFTVRKEVQLVSITMTYGYVPTNVYYAFLISSGIINYQPVIQTYMLNVIDYLYADEKTKCDVNNIKALSRNVM
jgi:hypothetical protein